MSNEDKITVQIDSDLKELIPAFLENRNTDIEKLRIALDGNNFENVQFIAHSIKGVGGGYGFEQMSEIAASLESASKDNDKQTAKEKIDQLDNYLHRLDIQYI